VGTVFKVNLVVDALALIGFAAFSAACVGYVLFADRMVSGQ
jgi:hypothetical protein